MLLSRESEDVIGSGAFVGEVGMGFLTGGAVGAFVGSDSPPLKGKGF